MARYRIIFFVTLLLIIIGLIMIGSASVVDASRDFGDKWYYLKLQSIWSVIGLAGFIFFSRWPSQKLEKLAKPLFFVTSFLLAIVLIPGIGTKLLGARRWINLGFFNLQPAELAKFTICIYLSAVLKRSSDFLPFIIPVALYCGLVVLEPDLGTSLVIGFASIISYLTVTGKIGKIVTLTPLLVAIIAGIIILSPYRAARLKSFLDYSHDPLGSSYHIRQALLAVGSGGFSGVGLGQSRQKYEFLPEVTTDSIFAVIGEELGLIGGVSLLAIFSLLITTGFQVAGNAKNHFSANLALTITSIIGVQAFLNISAIIALVPLTGVPLPFISYGGSSLLVVLFLMGILVNLAKTENI
jgi:cell division protein FtsW